MKIKIKRIPRDESTKWDVLVSESSSGTLFHQTWWLENTCPNYDIWGFYKGNNLIGGFVANYKNILGHRIVTIPHLAPYSGVVLKFDSTNYAKRQSFENRITATIAKFIKQKYRWGFTKFHPAILDTRSFIWNNYRILPWYTLILKFSSNDIIWDNFHKNVKRNIRKAKNDGFTVAIEEKIEDALSLVEKSYESQNLVYKKKSVNRIIRVAKKQNLCKSFTCIDDEGKKVASSIIVWDEKRAYGLLGGIDRERRYRNAQSLCEYEVINYVKQKLALPEYDLNTGMLESVQEFYRKFGPKLQNCFLIKWGKGLDLMIGLNALYRKVTARM